MNICPITYNPCGDRKYSLEGLKLLSRNLNDLKDIPLTQEEQIKEAAVRAVKMSIQGVQPKLSARLNLKESSFIIVDNGGTFILKPQNNFYPQLPENEDLTMKLAETVGLDVPLHGMVYSIDSKLTYFIKRFDRYGRDKKYSLEDFAQLAGKSRETKYDFSMEKIVDIIKQYCTFPVIEFVKLFRLTLFNFLIGNEDQHLKNFSLITRNHKVELSPTYDLINTTIAAPNPQEEIALPLMGKKKKLSRKILIDYRGKERLGMNEKTVFRICDEIKDSINMWHELISKSFLSEEMKEKYVNLISERYKILFG
ncbi:MAG: HipA domain-containing protein [Bacteroidetes bacterium]|nr:HipA domain-containing protein [Bacteroidota bacterium]